MRTIHGSRLPDLAAIQTKGLLAVKIAQHFALRIDFLDVEVCRHLSQLFRNTLPIPPENLDALLERAVDSSWRQQVRNIAPTPFASASVGQVHRATLQDGTPLAVKIIKGNFKKQFLKDIQTVRRYLKLLLIVRPALRKVFDPLGILDYIKSYTMDELDLRNEIAGRETLLQTAAPYRAFHDLSKLRYPDYYPDLSSEGVLVSRFIEGKTFDELLNEGQMQYQQLLDLFHIHGLFLFGPGVFHGDIHPGNIILTPEGHICFVDTSAVSRVGEKIRRGLFHFFLALVDYDYQACTERLNQMAEKPIDGPRFTRFRERFFELYRDFKGKSVSEVSLTKKMMDSIKLGVESGMEFETGMFAVIKSLMYLDGMVLRCKPEADLVGDMRPVILNFQRVVEQCP